MPVELAQARKGDMRDVHVEAHADRIGGDEIIDFARLEHRHLRIARARRQRAHHHRCTTAQPPQHLGNRVNFLGRESDDHRAFGQSRNFARTCVRQCRKARARDNLRPRHQRLDHRPQRFGPQNHRFVAAARTHQAIGEDMSAFGIGAELRFVERDKAKFAIERHAFGSTQKPARTGRDDAFLAGDQRDFLRPLDLDHPVINFAREQPQWKADHPARMATQTLDREMRLAGVGRAKHGSDRGAGEVGHDHLKIARRPPRCNRSTAINFRPESVRLGANPLVGALQRLTANFVPDPTG